MGGVPQQTMGPRGLCRVGVALPGVRLHSSCFLESTMRANGPKQAVNKRLLGLASERPGVLARGIPRNPGFLFRCAEQ